MNNILSNILLATELAFDSFKNNKLRSLLAILGVTIGIASIIIVFSAGEGVKGLLQAQVESFGANVTQAEIKIPSSKKGVAGEQQSAMALLQGAQVTTMTHEDLEDVLELENVKDAYGLMITQEGVSYREELAQALIWATSASFIDIDQTSVRHGRFFSEAENRSLAQVVILGNGIAEKLFGDSDPLDKTIKIRDTRFRVIGVMEERGAMMSFEFDDFLYLPVKTLHKKIMGIDYFTNIMAELNDLSLAGQTNEEIRDIMRRNHNIDPPEQESDNLFDTGKDDFRIASMTEILEIFDDMSVVLTILLLAIVAVSLVVGGVGVMNMMYVIVNERTAEIGLRKAVGAKYSDIMLQLLVESIWITTGGGIAGIAGGILVSYGVFLGASSAGYDWNFHIPPIAFVTAFLFSIIFGIIFGLFPARKAAVLEPIEAMRHKK